MYGQIQARPRSNDKDLSVGEPLTQERLAPTCVYPTASAKTHGPPAAPLLERKQQQIRRYTLTCASTSTVLH